MARHINVWSDTRFGSPLRRVIYADCPAVLDAGDRAYFRATRERELGMTLEADCAAPEDQLGTLQQACPPLERRFKSRTFAARHRLTRTTLYFRYSSGHDSAVPRRSWLQVPPTHQADPAKVGYYLMGYTSLLDLRTRSISCVLDDSYLGPIWAKADSDHF